jgi:hypothetical protein
MDDKGLLYSDDFMQSEQCSVFYALKTNTFVAVAITGELSAIALAKFSGDTNNVSLHPAAVDAHSATVALQQPTRVRSPQEPTV